MEIPEELIRSPRVVRVTRGMLAKLVVVRLVTGPLVVLGVAAVGWMVMVILWAGLGVDRPVASGGAQTQKAQVVRTFGSGVMTYSKTMSAGESPWQEAAVVCGTGLMAAGLGVVGWIFCFTMPGRRRRLYVRGEAVSGEIIKKFRGLNGKLIAHSLIYEFTTITGERVQGNLVLRRPLWDTAEEGEAIVLYDIDEPGRSVLYAFGGYWCEV